jgi:hypothetical protein
MADQSSSLIHLDVNDFPKDQSSSNSECRVIWHPLEHMNGHLFIKSPSILDIEKISVHLEGKWPASVTHLSERFSSDHLQDFQESGFKH